jgi:hypothetical protein
VSDALISRDAGGTEQQIDAVPRDAGGTKRQTDAVLSPVGTAVAVLLIVGFLVLVAALIWMRDDANWERLVYVFAGYEALVFAGAGALFGTNVQRSTVSTARNEAEQARRRADAAEQDATSGRALAQVVQTKHSMRGGTSARGARPGEPGSSGVGDTDLAELAALADTMFRHS